ncbi:MAG: PIG-L deacetylase family protein [Planctomycetota bacterium]
MISTNLLSNVRSVLCLGAHSDDIEIGAGGTILRLLAESPNVAVTWCVFSGNEQRHAEAKASAADYAPNADVRCFGFRDGFFPQQHAAIKDEFEKLKDDYDLILTHRLDDAHQDHRVLAELAWNTFRSHLILQYEIPKWDGDLATPNGYVHLEPDVADRKCELLMKHFGTQRSKHWFDEETFKSLMRLRGLESNARYAEGFHLRKLVL